MFRDMCYTRARVDGKVAIVTGGGTGLGFETAKILASRGARVIIASRNETKLAKATADLKRATGNDNIAYRIVDLGSLKSVRNFVSETVNSESRLDILYNNAAAVGLPDRLSEDGLNLTMQVNYFGTFLLTYLLLPFLRASAPSRIINTAASSKYLTEIDFDHWNDVGTNNILPAIAASQLAVELFTTELDKRISGTGVTVNSFDPYVVRDTDLLFNLRSPLREVLRLVYQTLGLPKVDVAHQVTYLIADPSLEKVSGRSYEFCRVAAKPWWAYDATLTKRLWDMSKKAVKITREEDWEVNDINKIY